MKYEDAVTLLQHVVVTGASLPAQVFNDPFSKFLFFDNDICSSDDLINSLKMIVTHSFGEDSVVAVYSSYDFSFIGELFMHDDWVRKLASFSHVMNENGDYYAMTLIDENKRWALFQKTPVEDGVLGIKGDKDLSPLNELIYDNFFDCEVLEEWLEEKTERARRLVQRPGKEYIMMMIENYGGKQS